MNISGQTAIVTGGASGLGEATARQLAAAGAKVGILDMNEELAQKVAAEIGGAAAVCDVVDAASHEAAVVTTASVAAFEGQIGQLDYAASKGGVAAMTIPMARELAREGIRVNCIAPGLMDTPMMAGLSEPVKQSLLETTVYPKRLGTADEYGALAVHIAENTFMNGSVIRFDGALRMAPK